MKQEARQRRGQTTAEYAITISFVLAALIGMQTYVNRGLKAKYKAVADSTVTTLTRPGFGLNGGVADNQYKQYEPYYVDSSYEVTQDAARQDLMKEGGTFTRTGIDETTHREGFQTTSASKNDDETP